MILEQGLSKKPQQDSIDPIYCYPGIDVLKNKLGIKDKAQLKIVERKLTMLRIHDLIQNPIYGKFDLEHLKSIHKYIFQDIYSWAGELRTVDIGKGNMFCHVAYIEMQVNSLFNKLKQENFLRGLSINAFAKRAAYYFAEINALHPFREGNGRVQREFIRTLALLNGYTIRYSTITPNRMLYACVESFMCNYDPLEDILLECISKD
jgi:cell filamentation protein